MAARLAIPLLIVATVSTFGQTDIQTRIARKVDAKEQRTSQVVISPGPDVRAARLQMFNRDVSELTASEPVGAIGPDGNCKGECW